MRLRRVLVGCAVALGVTAAMLPAKPAEAAGIVTHAWMALDAIDQVQSDSLRALLDAHRDQVRAGAEFPDGGYWTDDTPAGDYGEEAHWQRFADAMATLIQAQGLRRADRPERPLRGGDRPPDGRRRPRHGRRGVGLAVRAQRPPTAASTYTRPTWPPSWHRAARRSMDLVAIGVHGRPDDPVPAAALADDLIAAFAAVGPAGDHRGQARPGQGGVRHGRASGRVEWARSTSTARGRCPGCRRTSSPPRAASIVRRPPSPASRMPSGPSSSASRSHEGGRSPTRPTDRRGIPATGWVRTYLPGSVARAAAPAPASPPCSPTRCRTSAAGSSGHTPAQLPAGAMVLREARTGQALPTMAGLSPDRPVRRRHRRAHHRLPAGRRPPAVQLVPGRGHRRSSIDASGQPVRPYSWRFRTGEGDAPRLSLT